jgi:hypothetical protein
VFISRQRSALSVQPQAHLVALPAEQGIEVLRLSEVTASRQRHTHQFPIGHRDKVTANQRQRSGFEDVKLASGSASVVGQFSRPAYTPSMAFKLLLPSPLGTAEHDYGDDVTFEISPSGTLKITYGRVGNVARYFGVGQWVEVAQNTDPISGLIGD